MVDKKSGPTKLSQEDLDGILKSSESDFSEAEPEALDSLPVFLKDKLSMYYGSADVGDALKIRLNERIESWGMGALEIELAYDTSMISGYSEGEALVGYIIHVCDKARTHAIFEKFDSICQSLNKIQIFLQEVLGELPGNEAISTIEANVLSKTKRALDIYCDEASSGPYDSTNQYLETYVTSIQEDILLLESVVLEARKSGLPVRAESLEAISFTSISGLELIDKGGNDQLRYQLYDIVSENWRFEGGLGKKVVEDFSNLLHDSLRLENATFYIELYRDSPVAFFRMDETPEGELLFASVNTKKDLEGIGAASTLFNNLYEVAAKGRQVNAYCSPVAPVATKYIRELGFVIKDIISYSSPDDAFMIRNNRRPGAPTYHLSGTSFEELEKLAPIYQGLEKEIRVKEYRFPDEYQRFVEDSKALLRAEPPWVISAYQREKTDSEHYRVLVGMELEEEIMSLTDVLEDSLVAS